MRSEGRCATIAALYDIHGNLPALEAALAASSDADLLVIGGDAVWEPMPDGVTERLRDLPRPAVFIRGNADCELVGAGDRQNGRSDAGSVGDDITEWAAQRITERDRDLTASWPERAVVSLPGFGTILFCHATPGSDEELFTPRTPETDLGEMFRETCDARLVIVGHAHVQFEPSGSAMSPRRSLMASSSGSAAC